MADISEHALGKLLVPSCLCLFLDMDGGTLVTCLMKSTFAGRALEDAQFPHGQRLQWIDDE